VDQRARQVVERVERGQAGNQVEGLAEFERVLLFDRVFAIDRCGIGADNLTVRKMQILPHVADDQRAARGMAQEGEPLGDVGGKRIVQPVRGIEQRL
jgi:hypothetical protein